MNCRLAIAQWFAVLGFLSPLAPSLLAGQAPGEITGIVTDASTARALFGATVTLDGGRVTRTDQTGAFVIPRVTAGTHSLLIRQFGYSPRTETVVVDGETHVTVKLDRIAALDTVRVQGSRQAIYGIVAASAEFRPLPNSTVQILGQSVGQVTTDSAGRFFYPIQSAGVYLVRVKASGFATRSVGVTVNKGSGVEVALMLDADEGGQNHAVEAAYFDFKERLMRRGRASALIPRSELIQQLSGDMVAALLATPLFTSTGLRFTQNACVFIDGRPQAGLSLNSIDVQDVEAVEVYSQNGERSGTLENAWPRQSRCGDTGMPRVDAGRAGLRIPAAEVVRWVVIWLKH